MPFSEARTHLTDLVNQVAYRKDRIVITRKGKELVAIVPLEDLVILQKLEDQLDLQDAEESLRSVEKLGTVSWESVRRELGL